MNVSIRLNGNDGGNHDGNGYLEEKTNDWFPWMIMVIIMTPTAVTVLVMVAHACPEYEE